MAAISNDWLPVLKEEFGKPYYRQLFQTVNQEYRTHQVFPPAEDIFNAFHLTPFHQVKVVILGQDPYHNYGQAHGLCFSVKKGVEIPPSLVNIYQELHDDLGCEIPDHGCAFRYCLMLRTLVVFSLMQSKTNSIWLLFSFKNLDFTNSAG